ncbi:hypothetical protein YC2023_108996 [Brassica napus]
MASAVRPGPLAILRARFVPACTPYGERGSSQPARQMASAVRPVPLAICDTSNPLAMRRALNSGRLRKLGPLGFPNLTEIDGVNFGSYILHVCHPRWTVSLRIRKTQRTALPTVLWNF